MSSPPTKYIKSYDYAATPPLNVDFDRVKATTDQTIDRLALIQRDDGGLKDGLITTASLADGSVTEPKYATGSVSTRALADGSVTGPKIQPGSINGAALAPGSIGSTQLQDGGIQTIDLSDLSVTQQKLSLLSVGTPQLIDASVTPAKLSPAVFSAFAPAAHTHPESDVVNLIADLALKAPLASPVLTGVPTAPTPATGTNTTQLATTAFVAASMSAAGAITEAPNDGLLYGRMALGWQRGVKLAGDTMTGLLLLSADPAAPLGAATKQYVDAVQTLATGKVSKAGDTMTGNLGIGRTPEAWNPLHRVVALGLSSTFIGENASNGAYIGSNLWNDGAAWRLIGAAGGCLGGWGGGTFTWYTTPAGVANALSPLTERMRLDINGVLCINTAAPYSTEKLSVDGSILAKTGNMIALTGGFASKGVAQYVNGFYVGSPGAGGNYLGEAVGIWSGSLTIVTWNFGSGFALVAINDAGQVSILGSSQALGGNNCFDTVNNVSSNGGNGLSITTNGGLVFAQTKANYTGGAIKMSRIN